MRLELPSTASYLPGTMKAKSVVKDPEGKYRLVAAGALSTDCGETDFKPAWIIISEDIGLQGAEILSRRSGL